MKQRPRNLPMMTDYGLRMVASMKREIESSALLKIIEATATCWLCSGLAARRDLDFQPVKTLDERLRETAAWYLDHRWLESPLSPPSWPPA